MIHLFKNRVRFWPRTAEIEPLQFFDRVVGTKLAIDEIARHTPVPAVLANEPVQDVEYFGLHIGSSFLIPGRMIRGGTAPTGNVPKSGVAAKKKIAYFRHKFKEIAKNLA